MLAQTEILKLVHTIQIETRKTMHSEMKVLIEKEMRKMVREEMRVIAEPLEEDIGTIKKEVTLTRKDIKEIRKDVGNVKRTITRIDKKHDGLFIHLDKFALMLLTSINRIERHFRLPVTSLESQSLKS